LLKNKRQISIDFTTEGLEKHEGWPGPYDVVNIGMPWGGQGRFAWSPHHHEAIELVSLPAGVSGKIIANGNFFSIDRPMFFSFPPGHVHSYDLYFSGTPLFAILLINPAFLPQTISIFNGLNHAQLERKINGLEYAHENQAHILHDLIFRLSKVRGWINPVIVDENPVRTALEDVGILLDIIARLFSREPNPEAETRSSEPVRRAISTVESHFSEPLTLGSIAKASSASKYHLCRIFKSHTGLSLWSYVNAVRIRHAVHLLTQGSTNMTEVCYECGFTDPSYFAKVFKH
jgi:AraC-like DNA-binding protein